MSASIVRGSRTIKTLAAFALLLGAGVATAWHAPWTEGTAHAYIRGGYVGVPGDGGMVGVSRTTWVPGVGVSRATVVGGRYRTIEDADPPLLFNPPARVPGRPGGIYGWTARGIRVGAIYAGPSAGAVFRFGPYVRALPGGCATMFWQGTAAYRCGAQVYVYDVLNGTAVYYPVMY